VKKTTRNKGKSYIKKSRLTSGRKTAKKTVRRSTNKNKKTSNKKNDWVKKAIKNPGAFRAYCQKHGFSKVNTQCINIGLKSKDPTTRRRAALAKALKNMRKKRQQKLKQRKG